jgi:hypothetical protein
MEPTGVPKRRRINTTRQVMTQKTRIDQYVTCVQMLSMPIRKASSLTLIVGVCCEHHAKHINTPRGKNVVS